MKMGFYPKIAWDGIKKNRRFYIPYILTCVGMIMMYYIIHHLAGMPALRNMSGGNSVKLILGFGCWIVALFALIFLFYSNSFLMRRRKKEFGLYNMLGMGKGNLCRLLLWESLILFLISMAGGLVCGILLSKTAELIMVRMLEGDVTYGMIIYADAFRDTWLIFAAIFTLIFIKGLITVSRSGAITLAQSESVGEKPPKANYVLGIAGALLLIVAYYISVSIQNPLTAMVWFFIAVCLVIVATYLLFISGSVTLCRLLQKNKRYYYRKNHFVSVSSMVYRMKRNGAGLASICILSTMVLVIVMGAGTLYIGKEESLNTRYPHDISSSIEYIPYVFEGDFDPENESIKPYEEESLNEYCGRIDAVLSEYGVETENVEQTLSVTAYGVLKDGLLSFDPVDTQTMDYSVRIQLIPLSVYNACMNTNETLESGEVFIYCVSTNFDESGINLPDGTVLTVKEQLKSIMGSEDSIKYATPTVFIVTDEVESLTEKFNAELSRISSGSRCRFKLGYAFDTNASAETQAELCDKITAEIQSYIGESGSYSYSVECKQAESADFYGIYGGIFLLGVFLSVVFIAATVLIIYYKQVTEGYEDEKRFEIMRNVGMSKEDIRKNVNSQMLTVFALPLITAAVHTAFAFPIVQKMIEMFNLNNALLSLAVTATAIVVFAVFYVVVYKITSNAYYAIVSGKSGKKN
jgi:putative ABC transport system permease protein